MIDVTTAIDDDEIAAMTMFVADCRALIPTDANPEDSQFPDYVDAFDHALNARTPYARAMWHMMSDLADDYAEFVRC